MFFVFQAEDGIRDLVRSRGLGDVYKRQVKVHNQVRGLQPWPGATTYLADNQIKITAARPWSCLLYTSDAADERSSVDLGGRRIIKKKNATKLATHRARPS